MSLYAYTRIAENRYRERFGLDFEDFKRFYLIFRKEAFVKTDGITCFLDSLLA